MSRQRSKKFKPTTEVEDQADILRDFSTFCIVQNIKFDLSVSDYRMKIQSLEEEEEPANFHNPSPELLHFYDVVDKNVPKVGDFHPTASAELDAGGFTPEVYSYLCKVKIMIDMQQRVLWALEKKYSQVAAVAIKKNLCKKFDQ